MIGNGWEWTRDLFAPFEGFASRMRFIPDIPPPAIFSTGSTM